MSAPRVTLAIAAYNGERFLAEAIESCLAQDYADFELLIVDDASTDSTPAVIARYASDPRVRVVTHAENRGIAAAYNSIVEHARGELIARLGHDDVALPDRLSRQVAIFDAHPDTAVVHGDAVTIDASGRAVGEWRSGEFDQAALVQTLVRRHNYLVDPTTMIHRRVYEQVGGYDAAYPMCNDFDLWLRAAPRFRFRHCDGGPLIRYRRHGANFSDESARAREIDEVTRALEAAIEREDWAVLAPEAATREGALVLLADALERRALPLPELAARLRERGLRGRRRIVMTSFGFNDSGGGTIVPRYVSKELARRGYDVTVFHAGVGRVEPAEPYAVREWWRTASGSSACTTARTACSTWAIPTASSTTRRSRAPSPSCSIVCSPTSSTSTTCTTWARRWSTRPRCAGSARSSRPTTTGSPARAATSSPTGSSCATAPATAAATAPPASAAWTPRATAAA